MLSRLRFVWRRSRLSDEAAEELRLNLELLTARYRDAGMTPDGARLAAKRQLGNVALVQEDIRRMNSLHWLDVLLQDVRHAFRSFGRNPAFAAVVAPTPGPRIGANTAVLSLAYA